MFSAFLLGAVSAIQIALVENDAFERSLEGLPPETQAALRAKRAEYFRERKRDWQHQELCNAIRDSRPRGIGIFW